MRAATLAMAVLLSGCASLSGGARDDLADVGSAGGRQCSASPVPGRLAAAEDLLDSRAVLAELADQPPGRTVLSLIYGPDGRALRNEVVVAGAGYDASLHIRNAVAAHLLPQKARRPWGERLIVETGPNAGFSVQRQEVCPAQALDGRVQDSYVVGVGASYPGSAIDPVDVDRDGRAGYRKVRVQALIDQYGRVGDLSLVGSTGITYPGEASRNGPLGWLYDVTFEPTLIDGIPTAAWVDLWLLVPGPELDLAGGVYGGWGTPIPGRWWPRQPRPPRVPAPDTADSGGADPSEGGRAHPDTVGITLPTDMPRVLPPGGSNVGRDGNGGGEAGPPRRPLLPPSPPAEPGTAPSAGGAPTPPAPSHEKRVDPRDYRPHGHGGAPSRPASPKPASPKPAARSKPGNVSRKAHGSPAPKAASPKSHGAPAPKPPSPKAHGSESGGTGPGDAGRPARPSFATTTDR